MIAIQIKIKGFYFFLNFGGFRSYCVRYKRWEFDKFVEAQGFRSRIRLGVFS